MVLGLFMFGFEGDEPSVFDETLQFNIAAKFDMCAYSLLTPYPGTIMWFEMLQRKQIVSFDWDKYEQSISFLNRPDFRLSSYIKGIWTPMKDFIRRLRCCAAFRGMAREPGKLALYNAFFRKVGIVTVTANNLSPCRRSNRTLPPSPAASAKCAWQELVMAVNETR